MLPGNVEAFYDAPIYARVPGYLKKWYVDIGSKVKAGDVLAEIETPELDQQLRQAEADLATATAKVEARRDHREPLAVDAGIDVGVQTGSRREEW